MVSILSKQPAVPKRFPKFGKLPGKPSTLLRAALDDLRKAEDSEVYEIEMGDWHRPDYAQDGRTQKCFVCLAGAVMAHTLKIPATRCTEPNDFGDEYDALKAIDSFRAGELRTAFKHLDLRLPLVISEEVNIPTYHESPKRFHKVMHSIADQLEKLGY